MIAAPNDATEHPTVPPVAGVDPADVEPTDCDGEALLAVRPTPVPRPRLPTPRLQKNAELATKNTPENEAVLDGVEPDVAEPGANEDATPVTAGAAPVPKPRRLARATESLTETDIDTPNADSAGEPGSDGHEEGLVEATADDEGAATPYVTPECIAAEAAADNTHLPDEEVDYAHLTIPTKTYDTVGKDRRSSVVYEDLHWPDDQAPRTPSPTDPKPSTPEPFEGETPQIEENWEGYPTPDHQPTVTPLEGGDTGASSVVGVKYITAPIQPPVTIPLTPAPTTNVASGGAESTEQVSPPTTKKMRRGILGSRRGKSKAKQEKKQEKKQPVKQVQKRRNTRHGGKLRFVPDYERIRVIDIVKNHWNNSEEKLQEALDWISDWEHGRTEERFPSPEPGSAPSQPVDEIDNLLSDIDASRARTRSDASTRRSDAIAAARLSGIEVDDSEPIWLIPDANTAEQGPRQCPLSDQAMVDPVILTCGHMFDRAPIEAHLAKDGTCPICFQASTLGPFDRVCLRKPTIPQPPPPTETYGHVDQPDSGLNTAEGLGTLNSTPPMTAGSEGGVATTARVGPAGCRQSLFNRFGAVIESIQTIQSNGGQPRLKSRPAVALGGVAEESEEPSTDDQASMESGSDKHESVDGIDIYVDVADPDGSRSNVADCEGRREGAGAEAEDEVCLIYDGVETQTGAELSKAISLEPVRSSTA